MHLLVPGRLANPPGVRAAKAAGPGASAPAIHPATPPRASALRRGFHGAATRRSRGLPRRYPCIRAVFDGAQPSVCERRVDVRPPGAHDGARLVDGEQRLRQRRARRFLPTSTSLRAARTTVMLALKVSFIPSFFMAASSSGAIARIFCSTRGVTLALRPPLLRDPGSGVSGALGSPANRFTSCTRVSRMRRSRCRRAASGPIWRA